MQPSTTGVITATGTKGLLTYLKTYQPELYAKANPTLIAYAKKQNAIATMGRMGTMRGFAAMRLGTMAKLGGANLGLLGSGSSYFSTIDPNTGNDLNTLSDIEVEPISVNTPPDLTITPSSAATDSASVASPGATSSGFANVIASIAKGIGTATLTAAQVSANNTLLATNLARAQQGLPPLTASTGASGLTTLGSSSSLLLLGGALLLGLVALGGNKSS
jgi:hypothetical protein